MTECFFIITLAKGFILDRDPQEELKKAFKLFSEDSSNKISFRTLRKIAKWVSGLHPFVGPFGDLYVLGLDN